MIAADPSLTPAAGDAAVTARQLLTYYPGTANATEAGPIKVGGGDEVTGIEWPIVRGGTYKITGTVVDSRGQPLAGASVTVMARVSDGGFRGTGVEAATDGTFAARNVVAGDYFPVVRPTFLTKDMPPDAEFAVHPVTVNADVEGVLLTTRRGATVTGTVTFDAASGASPSRTTVIAMTVDQQPRPTGLPPSSPIASDGAFRLEHVFGSVLLRVSGATGWTLESVTADGKDVTDVPTDFGSATSLVTIVMTKRGATLSGVVLDADRNPIPDATVLLFGEPPSTWHMRYSTTRSAISEAGGRFTLTAVRPGAYFVVAVRRADLPGASLTASDFERLSKLAARVELRDGQTRTLDLETIPSPR